MICQHGSCLFNIFHSLIDSTTFLTQIHDRSDVLGCHHDLCLYHRLFHIFNLCRIRHVCRVCQIDHITVCLMDLVNNTRCCCNKIKVVLSFQTFLNDLQMKESQESTTESESKCYRCLCLKLKRSIIKLQFLKCISQVRILCSVCRIKSAIYHRIYFLISRKWFCTRILCIRDRISDTGILYILKTGCDISYHSCFKCVTWNELSRSKSSNFYNFCFRTCCHHKHRCTFFDRTFLDTAEYNNSLVRIVLGIKDQCLKRCIRISDR